MRFRATVLLALSCVAAVGAQAQAPQAPNASARADTGSRRPLPLNPGRKLAFSATKGSWMSLDVSPDGKTIVFDLRSKAERRRA